MGKKKDLPEKLQIGEAWKVFGKWMVAIGESDQNEVNIPNYGIKSGHICIVLRGLGFTLYFYELIDDYTEEQYKAFNHIRLILDRVLITNQAASARLKFFLSRCDGWTGPVFPKFFSKFPQSKIKKWSSQIDEEIEKWSNEPFEFKNIDRKKYLQQVLNPKNRRLLYDVKGCYEMLLSALNTLKLTLPEENIEIIDELILRCEHGYFLGFLLEKTIEEYEKKHKKIANDAQAIRSQNYLRNRVDKFRNGREEKVLLASKEAFGLTNEVKEKLNRMFIMKEVK
jgi:hypothetical protein